MNVRVTIGNEVVWKSIKVTIHYED